MSDTKQWKTKILKPEQMDEAVQHIREGNVVAFPTETVYGLGGNALDSSSVSKIFIAKGRPSDNPLIVHISKIEMLKDLVAEEAYPIEGTIQNTVIQKFWPGPLTLLFKKSKIVPDTVTAGLPYVAVRMPKHKIANDFISACGLPIAAPSANRSGRPSPTEAKHVFDDLNNRIPCILDGGPVSIGVESTVIDLNRTPPLLLRPGGITFEQLKDVVPDLELYEKQVHGTALEQQPPTPGLKYKHYSPNALVYLIEQQTSSKLKSTIQALICKMQLDDKNSKIGIIHTHKNTLQYDPSILNDPNIHLYILGSEDDYQQIAKGIFKALRDLDDKRVNSIIIEGISEQNEGLAIMNRVRKAATEIIL